MDVVAWGRQRIACNLLRSGSRLIRRRAQRSFRCADRDRFDRVFNAEWMRVQADIVDDRRELVD